MRIAGSRCAARPARARRGCRPAGSPACRCRARGTASSRRGGPAPAPARAGSGTPGRARASHCAVSRRHVLEVEGRDIDLAREVRQRRSGRGSRPAAAARPGRRRHRPTLSSTRKRRPSGAPASASMRASWPPPRIPTVVMRRRRHGGSHGDASRQARVRPGQHVLGLERRNSASACATCGSPAASSAAANSAGVDRAGAADGEGRHRHAAGICTIDSSESRPLSALRLHRHAQHRHQRSWRPACPAGAPRRRRRR